MELKSKIKEQHDINLVLTSTLLFPKVFFSTVIVH